MSDNQGEERGFLTKADKKYLGGERQLTEGSEYNTKRRIRERTRQALLDFGILFEEMEHSERVKIFPKGTAKQEDPVFKEGARDALAFILERASVTHLMGHSDPVPRNAANLLIEQALIRVGKRNDFLVHEAHLEIEADRIPVPNLLRDLEEERELPPEALRYLMEFEEVDTQQVQELLREMITKQDSGSV